MSKICALSVKLDNNPASFFTPFKFTVEYEARETLEQDTEWAVRYVGSALSPEHDQILDSILVGPITQGRHRFTMEVPPPNPDLIPPNDAVGATVVMLEASYREKMFLTIGYFVRLEYNEPELNESLPPTPLFDKLVRSICDEPRTTYYPISWDDMLTEMHIANPVVTEVEEEEEEEDEDQPDFSSSNDAD